MRPRKYTKSIEVWKTTTVADGYGGNVVTTDFDYSIWANVTTKNSSRLNENGQNDNFVQTIFTVRNRVNLDLTIKYNFIKYNEYNKIKVINLKSMLPIMTVNPRRQLWKKKLPPLKRTPTAVTATS